MTTLLASAVVGLAAAMTASAAEIPNPDFEVGPLGGVPVELHVYPHGVHGPGPAPDGPHVATWADLCCEWLRALGS